MSIGAKFVLLKDGQGPDICIYHDGEIEHEIAWSAVPESGELDDTDVKDRFKWLIDAAAAFHEIPVEIETIK